MEDGKIVESLSLFGLTRQEANLYICLFLNEELTGYEVAKKTGISRSNVYNGLSGLVDKGAAYCSEGASLKYSAVPIEEFCDNKIGTLKKEKEYLIQNMPNKKLGQVGYLTIEGYSNILNKAVTLMRHAEKRIYLSAGSSFIEGIMDEINLLIARGIKVVLLTDSIINFEKTSNTRLYITENKYLQIGLIIDSQYVLTGDITGSPSDTCLYCGQPNFVEVFKGAMRNEIKLIEMTIGRKHL